MLPYDLVSFNIGSLLAGADSPAAAHAERIKPLHRAARLKQRLDAFVTGGGGAPVRIVVVGAGAGGVEVACAAARRWIGPEGRGRSSSWTARTRFSAGTAAIPAPCGPRARPVEHLPASRRRRRYDGGGPSAPGRWRLTAERSHGLAYGPAAAPLLAASGLPADPRGFLWIDESLRSTGDAAVFAVGDCGTLARHPSTPKAGVYAVREAPVLWHNLLATARGLPLAVYEPQRGFLFDPQYL